MTTAVCFKCGEFKFGAFGPCRACGTAPSNEDELAYSLAMTDHYFDQQTLAQIKQAIRNGEPPSLDPGTKAQLVKQIRSMPPLFGFVKRHERKPWWKFW